jgi:hypothetical protein
MMLFSIAQDKALPAITNRISAPKTMSLALDFKITYLED